jgi:hypothetical protein
MYVIEKQMHVKRKYRPTKLHHEKGMKKPTIDIDSSISSLVLPFTLPLKDSNILFRFFRRISRSSKATCRHLT